MRHESQRSSTTEEKGEPRLYPYAHKQPRDQELEKELEPLEEKQCGQIRPNLNLYYAQILRSDPESSMGWRLHLEAKKKVEICLSTGS